MRATEGLAGGFKGLAALPRTRGSTLAHGCGRGGRVVLPLPRAAAVSTGLRVQPERGEDAHGHQLVRVRVRARARLGVDDDLVLQAL